MNFDAIVGNPPYQVMDGGSRASAKPIYNFFVQNAKKIQPNYISMIMPSRWFSGGKGLDTFRNEMLHDTHLIEMVDYFDPAECFPDADISGGVCYFLWDRSTSSDCEIITHRHSTHSSMTRPLLEEGSDVFIRFNEAVSILRKVTALHEEKFFDTISSRKPFGLSTSVSIKESKGEGDIKIFAYPNDGFINRSKVKQNSEWIDKIKVCISYAYGERGDFPYLVIGKPFIAGKDSCCTETYLVLNTYSTEEIAENAISYIKTKFFRFLVLLKKNTQHATKNVYSFVPTQDFSKAWTDDELFEKYGLTESEISFIESMIRPM